MSAESGIPEEETVSMETAKQQVERAVRRIALLHLAFSKTFVDRDSSYIDKG